MNSATRGDAEASVIGRRQSGEGRLPAIDGLRGLAALMVLVCHLYGAPKGYGWQPSELFGYKVNPIAFLENGSTGVELFFVLSGFCLAYPILSRGRANWRQYFINRARRILPPYWIMYLTWAAVAWAVHVTDAEPWASTNLNQVAPWPRFLQGFFLIQIVYSGIFWTLVVEARWYFVLPLLITLYFVLNRRTLHPGWIIFALTCVISAPWAWLCKHSGIGPQLQQIFSAMPPTLWSFGIGILAADITHRKASGARFDSLLKLAPAALILLLVLLHIPLPEAAHLERLRSGLWTPFYFLLVLAALHLPWAIRLFSWRPLVAVGTFSYSLYLTHLLVEDLVYPVLKPLNWAPLTQLLFYQFILGPICVAVAYLFYLIAEKPFLRKPAPKAAG